MTAHAKDNVRTVLLLLPSKKEMYPMSTAAFTRAQASRKELRNDYADALILDREGSLRKIDHVKVLGPWGNSYARKLLSRLTDAWSVEVRLSEPLPHSLDQIKHLLAECIGSPQSANTMEIEDPEAQQKLIVAVNAATSIGELLGLIKLPAPEDALDVL